MENKELEFDQWDYEYSPVYSEYNPLSEEVKQEIQSILKPERKEENTGLCASLIRKLMPCKLV